jgi:O-acetyl-ADP-ribose deacetylase (regulator of RNase III)
MKFLLVDTNPAVCQAFKEMIPELDVRCCPLDNVSPWEYQILFTPGNSYGFMDGGFDLAVRNLFPESEGLVREKIAIEHAGLLPVGSVVDVGVQGKRLMYAPTMRIPKPILGTDNVYLAYRAALLASMKWIQAAEQGGSNPAILLSAFGTSAGMMPYLYAAGQLKLAIRDALSTQIQYSWSEAWLLESELKCWM